MKRYEQTPETIEDFEYLTHLKGNSKKFGNVSQIARQSLINARDENGLVKVTDTGRVLAFLVSDEGKIIADDSSYEKYLQTVEQIVSFCKANKLTPSGLVMAIKTDSHYLNQVTGWLELETVPVYLILKARGCHNLSKGILDEEETYKTEFYDAMAKELAKSL